MPDNLISLSWVVSLWNEKLKKPHWDLQAHVKKKSTSNDRTAGPDEKLIVLDHREMIDCLA